MLTDPRHLHRRLAALLCLALTCASIAFADGSDNFDDNNKDNDKWEADIALALGVLSEQNGRLEFTCPNLLSDGDTFRPWKERFPVSSNWSVQVDTANASVPAAFGQVNSGGFSLRHPTRADTEIYLELYAVPSAKGFVAHGKTDDVGFGATDVGAGGDEPRVAAVRMEYDAATKVITCYSDADATDGYQWTELATFGLAGAGGLTGNTDWQLNTTDQFAVWVYGYSAGMTVDSGELYLDNFGAVGSVPGNGGQPPVPTGNWQFGFPTNNPLLTAIASLTGNYVGLDPFGSGRTYNLDLAQDESGKVVAMGSVDGVTNETGGPELDLTVGAVVTANNEPTLELKTSFNGAGDGLPTTGKLSATVPLTLTDIGDGTNGLAGTGSVSAKVAGVPVTHSNAPGLIPATPSIENNFRRDWMLDLRIETKTVSGKELTVATATLTLPNGDLIEFPERKVKYSTSKGYKLSLSKGTNVTANPARLDKKTKLKITGLTFEKQGEDWVPTGGTIAYSFLGQKGTANLLDFTGP